MTQQNAAASNDDELLGHDDILNADDIKYEIVEVPEWAKNGKVPKVRVKALSAIERDDFEKSLVLMQGKKQSVNMANIRAKLCARAIVDNRGERVFQDHEAEKLGRKNAAAMDRIYSVAVRLSKISDDDIEDLKGNSNSDHSDDLSSG